MPNDLVIPHGWQATTLGSLGRYLNGRAFKSTEWGPTGRPIIRIQDLTGSNRNPNHFDGEVEDRYLVRPGDLLISWSATLGAYIWDGPEAVLNQHIFKVESTIDRKFHYHLARDRIAELERQAHGSGMVHVTKGIFEGMPVAVPEDEEVQKQIANLIDRAEGKRTSASQHVEAANGAIQRFRSAVLSAAVTGKLTGEWRDQNTDVRSVDDLVGELSMRRRLEQGSRYREPEMNRYAASGDLPASWSSVPLGLLLESIKYGTSQRSAYGIDGTAVLRIPNVSGTRFDLTDLKFAQLDEREAKKLSLEAGDLLMIRSNGSVDLVGKTRLVPADAVGMTYAGYLVRLRPDAEAIVSSFLELVLASPSLRVQIEMPARSTSGVNNINTDEIRALGIALPPLEEQREIIQQVESLFALADPVGARITAASRTVERSSQAILAKAFRGGLVAPEAA